jgi:hypothetical protein
MTTNTPKVGYTQWGDGDAFHIAEHSANWALADLIPGSFICTAATRPSTWGAPQTGRCIIETDTGLVWRWNGTQFVRQNAKGWIASTVRTTDFVTTSTALVTAVSVTVPMPSNGGLGLRRLMVIVECGGVASTVSATGLAIFRDATQLQAWTQPGGVTATAADQPRPVFAHTLDGPPGGVTYSYSLQVQALTALGGGTSTLKANPNAPLAIHVIEL